MRRVGSLFILVGLLAGSLHAADFKSAGFYQTYDDFLTWADTFAAANPSLVYKEVIGFTSQNAPLIALKLTAPAPGYPLPALNNPAKPEFLITAGLHAREVIGSEAARTIAQSLVQDYRAGLPAAVEALNEREVWILPDVNPDGRRQVEAGSSMQRKNWELYPTQHPDDYTRGVDINRNFPHRWNNATSVVTNEDFRGGQPLSSAEAAALWSLLHDPAQFNHLLGAIDIHSGAELVISPWTSAGDNILHPLPSADRARFDELGARLSQESGFAYGRLDYASFGTLTDSLYQEFGTYALTLEIYQDEWAADYFQTFNPIDPRVCAQREQSALSAVRYFLSDQAFPLNLPEPTTLALLATGSAWLLRRPRGVRNQGSARADLTPDR